MAFVLKKQPGKITHVDLREEKHGDESVPAIDIDVEVDLSNAFLDSLAPGLRGALYRPAGDAAGEQVDLLDPGAHLEVLRFPQVKTFKFDAPLIGAKVAFGKLEFEADVEKLRLSPIEGGSVMAKFQVRTLPDGDQVAALVGILGSKVNVWVTPATADLPGTEPG